MILMLTVGRSGSSMFAGIFHSHGIFTGKNHRPDQYNPKGYFENLDLKRRMKNRFGFDLLEPYPEYDPDWSPQVDTILHEQGYRGGPWLFKTGARYHALWRHYTPRIIKIRRDMDSVLDSYKRTNFLLTKYTLTQVEKILWDQMNVMESLHGPWLDYEIALSGDFSQLEDAFIWCGLKFDETIAKDFIDTSLRHF
jgi:hypothetical protein